MSDPMSWANTHIQKLAPYVPGKPAQWLERELGIKQSIKLASNENPLGTSSKVKDLLINHSGDFSLYPDSSGFKLKELLGEKHACAFEQITLGNGSEEIIRLLIQAFSEPGDNIVFPEYSFIAYQLIAQSLNVETRKAPLKQWRADPDALLNQVTSKTKIIFLANPGNPIGTYMPKESLLCFLGLVRSNILVVLDEAYFEYMAQSDYPDSPSLLASYPNLIVTRTFSKIYALAGLRIGYSLSHPQVADCLNRIRSPFNCNVLAQQAAIAALADDHHREQSFHLNEQGRLQYEAFCETKGIENISKSGNFVTLDLQKDIRPINQRLLEKGIITRDLIPYGLPNFLRISIGLPEQNERCLLALSASI